MERYFQPVQRNVQAEHQRPVPRRRVLSIQDQVLNCEVQLCLKFVESNYSYSSVENFAGVMRLCHPNSAVFSRLKISPDELSYLI